MKHRSRHYKQAKEFKYVGIETDYCVIYEGKILGFIHLNKKAKIQCTRNGDWFTGPRWELTTRDGKLLDNLPVSKIDAGRWLWEVSK